MNYLTGKRGKKGLIGIELVIANLHRQVAVIEGKTLAGMIEAAADLRADMENTPPLIPIDFGNLNASWFTVTTLGSTHGGEFISGNTKSSKKVKKTLIWDRSQIINHSRAIVGATKEPVLIMGFSANYAAPVHEMVGVHFKRPGSGAKFFQAALFRNTKKILATLHKHAKIS